MLLNNKLAPPRGAIYAIASKGSVGRKGFALSVQRARVDDVADIDGTRFRRLQREYRERIAAGIRCQFHRHLVRCPAEVRHRKNWRPRFRNSPEGLAIG